MIWFKAIRMFFVEFCANSTIHGIRYFTEQRRHWSERVFWMLSICLSLWFCGNNIRNIRNFWNKNPVKVTFTEENAPISDIPFPQVTICPEIKVTKDKLNLFYAYYAIRENQMNLSEIE